MSDFMLDKFFEGIQKAFVVIRIESENDEIKILKRKIDVDEIICKTSLETVDNLINELDGLSWDESSLYNETFFEVAVESHRARRPFNYGNEKYVAVEHGYEFCYSEASSKFLFALLCNYDNCFDERSRMNLMYNRKLRDGIELTLEELLSMLRIDTIKIKSRKKHSKKEFYRMLNAYIFNIAYNVDETFSVKNFSEKKKNQVRTIRNGQMFPYKAYNQELTKYYHQAIASDIPFTQYLAFYHVAEYFFQSISEQNAFQEIKDYIMRPSFSPTNKEEIKNFYNRMKKKMREQHEDGVWDEKTGLLLCLEKFVVDLESLKNEIQSIDSSIVEYYKNSEVSFADGGKKIDFDESTKNVYKNIRDRVYAVRNSIVHSKEGDKSRYEPFKHDKELAKEIPLIRSIAEEIIINSAKTAQIDFE